MTRLTTTALLVGVGAAGAAFLQPAGPPRAFAQRGAGGAHGPLCSAEPENWEANLNPVQR